MKVSIGKYPSWFGVYQLANLLVHVGVSEEKCNSVAKFLDDKTPLSKLCSWVHSKRKQSITVRIDPYDVWNANFTLATIIVPILERVIDWKDGTPMDIENYDGMPQDILGPADWDFKANNHEISPNTEQRWRWVLNEMLWAMKEIRDEKPNEPPLPYNCDDPESYAKWLEDGAMRTAWLDAMKAYNDRINRGTTLFGRYFQSIQA